MTMTQPAPHPSAWSAEVQRALQAPFAPQDRGDYWWSQFFEGSECRIG